MRFVAATLEQGTCKPRQSHAFHNRSTAVHRFAMTDLLHHAGQQRAARTGMYPILSPVVCILSLRKVQGRGEFPGFCEAAKDLNGG